MRPNNDVLKGLKILVVEDERDSREMVQFILEQSGASVSVAGSYVEAMEAFQRTEPDVVITDIAMPDQNGYALIAEIRAADKRTGKKTPAIALTAYTSPADRDTALASGFQEYIAKPFDPADLIASTAKLVQPPRAAGGQSTA